MRSGLIPRLSLLDHRKPAASRRDVVISPEQFEKLRGLVKNPAFGALLDFAWETGARPQELFLMEVQHLDAANQRIVLPVSKSKGKGKPRIIILTKKSLEIAVKACGERQQGPIFRNTKGKAWNAFSANLAFQMLRKRMAMENIPETTDDDIQIFIAKVSPTVREGGVERTRTPGGENRPSQNQVQGGRGAKACPEILSLSPVAFLAGQNPEIGNRLADGRHPHGAFGSEHGCQNLPTPKPFSRVFNRSP